jgi:hypothetical protein
MAALHPILQALLKLGDPTGRPPDKDRQGASFFAEGRFAARDLEVRVNGHGLLDQPLTAAQAQQLHDLSRPSQFGHRERTLLDRKVRHSGEIGADDVELAPDGPAWTRLLKQVSQELGSDPLEAWMHKLLIYGPGQFFKPHQDTEKREGMVGTLVLIWPCPHIGGALRVQHADQTTTFASQQLQSVDVRWCAFYADCRHEVLPVEEGWRVALTYDLVVPRVIRSPRAQAPDPEVLAALGAHFQSGERDISRPWVLMLDHEYTEHGLRWHLIKGHDRERVGALRDAADALGLTVHLALMQVQESWTAVTEYRGRHQRGGAVTPDELIERSFSLDFWVDRDGRVGPHASLSIQASDTESFTETGPEHLVNEEYEGYMGNWGETLDYWYRRAALVIQSPAAAERSRFSLDFAGALKSLRALARGPEASRQQAVEQIHRVQDLLTRQVTSQGRKLLSAYAELAASMPADETSLGLVRDFNPATFTPLDARALKLLQAAKGEAWLLLLIQAWTELKEDWRQRLQFRASTFDLHQDEDEDEDEDGNQQGDDAHGARAGTAAPRDGYSGLWPKELPRFITACLEKGLTPGVVEALFESLWFSNLRQKDAQEARLSPAARKASQAARIKAAVELVLALQVAPQPSVHLARVMEHALCQPALYPLTELAGLVLAYGTVGGALRERVLQALHTALAQPLRSADDHSLAHIEWTCPCADCRPVHSWARSSAADALILAMAQARREHVTQKVTESGAPFRLETLRQGSPHKLKLHKPTRLHEQEAEQRGRWMAALRQVTTPMPVPRGIPGP